MDLNAEIIREHSKAVALRLRVAPAFGMSSRTAIMWAAGPGAVLPVEKFLDIVCAFHPNQYASSARRTTWRGRASSPNCCASA